MNRFLTNRKQPNELKKPLNLMGRTIDDLVNYGDIIMNILESSNRNTELDTPIYTTFLHFLDTLDGIATLTKKGSTSGVKSLLRALFESSLNIKYLISETREKGVIAYQVAHAHREIKNRRLLDSSDDLGKEFIPKLESFLNKKVPTQKTDKSAKYLYAFLEREDVKCVNKEYQRTKKNNRGNHPNWHSLFNGPSSIRELAVHFDQELVHKFVYSELSSHLHSSGTMKLFEKNDSQAVLPGIRNPKGLQNQIVWVMNIATDTYMQIINHVSPNKRKSYAEWYVNVIRPNFAKIANSQLFEVKYETE